MFKPMLVALCLCSTAAAAQAPVHVTYSGYTHGFNVVDLDATLSLTPGHYKMELNYTLVGVLGTVLHGDGKTVVTGRFEGLHAAPDDLFSTGHFRGEPRATQIAWHGGNPSIVQLTPPVESERDPVPPALQANTIDTLSAMAGLIHQVAETGKCEEHGRTFDGRRLSEVTAHTVGQEALEQTGRSVFQGRRCAAISRASNWPGSSGTPTRTSCGSRRWGPRGSPPSSRASRRCRCGSRSPRRRLGTLRCI